MAATPPLQILSSPATPPSPLHGARYDRANIFPARRSTRAATRTTSRNLQTTPDPPRRSSRVGQATNTPSSPKSTTTTAAGLHSPEVTPKTRSSRRVQIMSPPSPDIHSFSSASTQPPTKSSSHLQPQSSSTTILDGMLPTPVKTPKKKTIANATTAARALFQDPAHMATHVAPVQPSPRRSRKSQRFNGFSLESFSAQDEAPRGQIQIYTDSRDRVPQVDTSAANPFTERKRGRESTPPQKFVGASKRRKVSATTRVDPQVTEAIDNDDGMVYVL